MFDFTVFPVLRTQRLLLRQLHPADAADVFGFRSDGEVQKYNSEPMTHISQSLELVYQMLEGYASQKSLCWGVTLHEENRVIGLFTLNSWDTWHRHAEIGYDLARAYWGQGLASEALDALLRFAFEAMELNHIEADTLAVNSASVRLLDRLGFQLEGVRREYILEADGLYYDSAIYGLLRREYFGS